MTEFGTVLLRTKIYGIVFIEMFCVQMHFKELYCIKERLNANSV